MKLVRVWEDCWVDPRFTIGLETRGGNVVLIQGTPHETITYVNLYDLPVDAAQVSKILNDAYNKIVEEDL